MDSPDRVSMKVSIFSPDGKNFCQFMTPNVPKPMFLAQFHPGLVGRWLFIFPKTDIWALGALKGPPGSTFGPLGPLGPGSAAAGSSGSAD